HPTRKVLAVAVPGSRVVDLACAAPVDIGKDDEPIGIARPKVTRVLGEMISQATIEAGADRDVVAIHDAYELVEDIDRIVRADAKVGVDVDNRKTGMLEWGSPYV